MYALNEEPGVIAGVGFWEKPCDNYCNVVLAQTGLEYANGSVADASNGSLLHHIVVLATGMDWKGTPRVDQVCSGLLHERMFSSGNERAPTSFGDVMTNKVISAFPLIPSDKLLAPFMLQNLDGVEKTVYVTVDFEYIPGKKPPNVKVAKAMWFDITSSENGCKDSVVFQTPTKARFTRTSPTWTSRFTGEMLGVSKFHSFPKGPFLSVRKVVICAMAVLP
jgi:hypothetical protein